MNMTMIDVTDIPGAKIGSEVVLLGARDGESISAEQLADWTGTINYEVCTTVAASVPRIAVDVPEELRVDFEQGGIPIAD
jgi:alanine racemase